MLPSLKASKSPNTSTKLVCDLSICFLLIRQDFLSALSSLSRSSSCAIKVSAIALNLSINSSINHERLEFQGDAGLECTVMDQQATAMRREHPGGPLHI